MIAEFGYGEDLISFKHLWRLFLSMIEDSSAPEMFCIIDGLDECRAEAQREFLSNLYRDLRNSDLTDQILSRGAKFLVTSQDTATANDYIFRAHSVRIRAAHVQPDINIYVMRRFTELGLKLGSDNWTTIFVTILSALSDGMFLWASLVLEELSCSDGNFSAQQLANTSTTDSGRLESLYTNMLMQIPQRDLIRARKVLSTLLFSTLKLSSNKFSIAMTEIPAGELISKIFEGRRNSAAAKQAKKNMWILDRY